MSTIALELVPTELDQGPQGAAEEGRRVVENARETGMTGRIKHLMIPGMIAEDDDRPVEMTPRMDPLDFWTAVAPEIGGVKGLCTQVTAFSDEQQLSQRLTDLRSAGMDGVIFVGVPRTMTDGAGPGVAPTDALKIFSAEVDNRGVILIPTREGEQGRFGFKCDRGATFGMTQLLYSDAIVGFLRDFAQEHEARPQVLLSFGFVPSVETKIGLIDWLIKDPGNPVVEAEQRFVADLAQRPFADRKRALLDLYQRVIDQVVDLGFPIGIHLEAPYGPSKPAFETFAAMLDYWSPPENG